MYNNTVFSNGGIERTCIGDKQMNDLSNNTVYGLGSIRIKPNEYLGTNQLKKAAKTIASSMERYIRGPIKVYSRGPNDLRIEYDFEVSVATAEWESNLLYQSVRQIVCDAVVIQDKWHHSHWIGVELVS